LNILDFRDIPEQVPQYGKRSIDYGTQLIMRHSIQAEGFGVRLRPIMLEDAAFVVWLRNLEHARGKVGDSAADIGAQEAWLKAYFQREGDYYFIIESKEHVPLGAYGIYNVMGKSAESGRWVVRPDVPAALPSAFLAFETAFGTLHLDELRVRTVSTNSVVLSLNRKFGFRQTHVEAAAQIIAGKPVDLVHFVLYSKDWPAVRQRLQPLALLAERQIRDWEQTQPQSGGGINSHN
jgi:RimJ/RimL family protein N-acetyltransferase